VKKRRPFVPVIGIKAMPAGTFIKLLGAGSRRLVFSLFPEHL
jgi:hypothetical protein